MLAVRVAQRVDGQLVERDQDDGRFRVRARRERLVRAREGQPRGIGVQQEEPEKEQRRRGEHGQDQPGSGETRIGDRRCRTEHSGDCDEQPAGSAGAPDRLEHEERYQ